MCIKSLCQRAREPISKKMCTTTGYMTTKSPLSEKPQFYPNAIDNLDTEHHNLVTILLTLWGKHISSLSYSWKKIYSHFRVRSVNISIFNVIMVLFLTFAIISNVTFSIYACLKLMPVILILNNLYYVYRHAHSRKFNWPIDVIVTLKMESRISRSLLQFYIGRIYCATHIFKENLNCGIFSNAFMSPTKPCLSYWQHRIIDNNKDGRNHLKEKKLMIFIELIHNLKPILKIRQLKRII